MNTNRFICSVLIVSGLLTASCTKHYYAPALYKNDISYQFKPTSEDQEKEATYISGSLLLGNAFSDDNVTAGELNVSRANTFENLNLSYGAFGYIGSYQNNAIKTGDPGYFNTKAFSGLGLRGSVNTYIKEGNKDLRLFGIEASYSQEFGEYADFRKTAQNIPYFYTDGSNSIFTAGLTNETVWHSKNTANVQYGYRLFFGAVFGNHQFLNNADPNNTNSPYLTYQKECISGAGFVQVNKYQGVVEIQNLSTITLRVGYRF